MKRKISPTEREASLASSVVKWSRSRASIHSVEPSLRAALVALNARGFTPPEAWQLRAMLIAADLSPTDAPQLTGINYSRIRRLVAKTGPSPVSYPEWIAIREVCLDLIDSRDIDARDDED
ncbi:MAG: hypothetical protein KKH12_15945 [Gammaproteobacteria bacterium]|nr:hypothetical protein [Gammaproteobacteria bacterium]